MLLTAWCKCYHKNVTLIAVHSVCLFNILEGYV